jgi:hypothetical protein
MGPGFCDVAKMGDHPENNLAKFGYMLVIKVGKKKKQNPLRKISFENFSKSKKRIFFLLKLLFNSGVQSRWKSRLR